MNLKERIGRALAVARIERGKTQPQAAAGVGLTISSISNIERGIHGRATSWQVLATYYGVTARELLERAARIPEPEETK